MVSLVQELNSNGKAELSIFANEPPAPPEDIVVATMKLATAFPKMEQGFFDILAERIVKRGLSKGRLQYAIDYVLDNFTYQRMTIADVMSIDRRVQVWVYEDMINEARRNGRTTDDYTQLFIGEEPKPYWVHKADKARFNIPDRI